MGFFRRLFGKKDALGNFTPEAQKLIAVALHGACFQWAVSLGREDQNRPEAAAVLMGMTDAMTRSIQSAIGRLTNEQLCMCVGATLCTLAESKVPLAQIKVDPDTLTRRMFASANDSRLLPWVLFAGSKVWNCLKDPDWHLKMVDTINEILNAVLAGTFNDPEAYSNAAMLLREEHGETTA
jgi:hypothetical protein